MLGQVIIGGISIQTLLAKKIEKFQNKSQGHQGWIVIGEKN